MNPVIIKEAGILFGTMLFQLCAHPLGPSILFVYQY